MNGYKPLEVVCLSLYTYCDSTTIHMFDLKGTHNVLYGCAKQEGERGGVIILKLSYDLSHFKNKTTTVMATALQ